MKYFPVGKVWVNGVEIEVESRRLGIFITELPLETYQLEYEVGCEEGAVPALVKELALNLTRYRLTEDAAYSADVPAIIKVLQEKREKDESSRNDY